MTELKHNLKVTEEEIIYDDLENSSQIARIIANAYDSFQKVRIESANRIRDVIRKRIEGIAFNEVEEKKKEKSHEKKYTDAKLIEMWGQLLKENKIAKKEHDNMIKGWNMMNEAKKLEQKYSRSMNRFLEDKIVYNEFLSKIRGIGPIISTNLLKEFGDCSKYRTVSSLWAHSGNNVLEDGKAPRRKKGENIGYSPRLRTLTWKISASLLKQNKAYYREIYDEDKEKQLKRTYEEGFLEAKYGAPYTKTDIKLIQKHAHNRALRKMRKHFLSHFWCASRELNGLPIDTTYIEGVLKHTHITSWKDIIRREEEFRALKSGKSEQEA